MIHEIRIKQTVIDVNGISSHLADEHRPIDNKKCCSSRINDIEPKLISQKRP